MVENWNSAVVTTYVTRPATQVGLVRNARPTAICVSVYIWGPARARMWADGQSPGGSPPACAGLPGLGRAGGDGDVGAPELAVAQPPQVHRAGARLPVQLACQRHVAEPRDVEDALLLQPPLDPRLQNAGEQFLVTCPSGRGGPPSCCSALARSARPAVSLGYVREVKQALGDGPGPGGSDLSAHVGAMGW